MSQNKAEWILPFLMLQKAVLHEFDSFRLRNTSYGCGPKQGEEAPRYWTRDRGEEDLRGKLPSVVCTWCWSNTSQCTASIIVAGCLKLSFSSADCVFFRENEGWGDLVSTPSLPYWVHLCGNRRWVRMSIWHINPMAQCYSPTLPWCQSAFSETTEYRHTEAQSLGIQFPGG